MVAKLRISEIIIIWSAITFLQLMSGQLSAACLPAVQVSFWPSFKTYEVLFITAKRFRKFNTPSQNYVASSDSYRNWAK